MKSSRLISWFIGMLLVTAGAFASPAVGGATTVGELGEVQASGEMLQVSPAPENNSTVQQRDPDSVDGGSDTDALRDWLSNRMAERLSESAVEVSEGEYEKADQLVGEKYQDLLSKYVDVAGETGEDDTEVGQTLNETATQQREYSELVSEYQRVNESYQAAVEAGNETRARELARRLQSLASQIEGVEANLTASYGALSKSTGADTSNASKSVNETAARISDEAATVVQNEFTNTSISATATAGSFSTPVTVTGVVSVPEGELPDSPVTIQVEGRELNADINSEGEFTIDYRPVTIESGTRSLSVRFVPSNDSEFLGSQTSTETRIGSIRPSVVNISASATASFGNPVSIQGRVVVNSSGVPGAAVQVRMGDITIAVTETNRSGSFSAAPALPAEVPVNASVVRVIAGENGTAITETNVQQRVSVTETATNLSIETSQSAQAVTLSGQLRTLADQPVGNQPVAVSVDGTVIDTVQTNASGHYRVRINSEQLGDESVTVRASFDGSKTNLASSSVVTGVQPGAEGLPGFISEERSPPWWLLAAFGASLLGLGYTSWRYLKSPTDNSTQEGPDATSEPEKEWVESSGDSESLEEQILAAESRIDDNDPETAIRLIYPTLRMMIGDQAPSAQTNWEFYRTTVDEVDSQTADTLLAATEAYEEVVYADSSPDRDEVEGVVSAVSRILDDDDHVAYPDGSQTTD